MRKLRITENSYSGAGNLPLPRNVVGVTIENKGGAPLKYSWNEESTSNTLQASEGKSYGGIEGYTLEDNILYFDFGDTGTKKALITILTHGPLKQDC